MLELRSVTAGYRGTTVLRDLSMVVAPGAVVALLGANGSGKTTTLRVASRLLDVTAGSIRLDGRDVTTARPLALADAGVCHVPEGRAIFPSLSVEENVSIFARGSDRAKAWDEAVDAFPALAGLERRVANTLSGGQQQMLALARAYVAAARYVLLDEVSMGLAPLVVKEIFEFLPRLRDRGMALVIVEQYVNQALSLADHVYLLNHGDLEFDGAPDDLRQSSSLAAAYLGAGQ